MDLNISAPSGWAGSREEVNYEPSRYSGSVSAIQTLMFHWTFAQTQTCAAIAGCTPLDPVMLTSLSCGSHHIARDSQLFGAMKLMTKDDIERDRCRVISKCMDNILLQNSFRAFFLETTTIKKSVRIKTWHLVHTMYSMYSLKNHFTCREKKHDFVPNTILQTNDHRRVTSASLLRSWSARQKSRMPPKVKVPETPGRSRAIRT